MSEKAASRNLHPIVRGRWFILVAFVALCAWLLPGLAHIENDDDVLAFLPPDHPEVVNFYEVAERFGMMEVALVGLGDEDGDVLQVEDVDTIRELSIKIRELPGVKTAISLADLPNPVVTEDGMVVAPLVPETLRDEAKIREQVLASTDAVGNFVSAKGRAGAIIVFLLPRSGSGTEAYRARRDHLKGIQDTVRDAWEGELHFAGAPFVETAASDSSRMDIERLSPIVIGVLAIASALLLRSLTAAVLNLLVTGLGVGLIMGGHGTFHEPLTIVSSSTPVMMVALGGAFGVHVLAGYQRQAGASLERASATLRELTRPVVLSGATTSVAFFALVVMPQVPMQRFGIVAGIGVLSLLVLALLVLPALLAVLPDGLLTTRQDRHLSLPFTPPAWALLVLFVAAAGVATTMRADPDTNNVFEEDSAPRRANAFFDEHFEGSTFLQVTVEGELGQAEVLRTMRDISEEVAALEGVVDVRSVVEPVEVINAGIGGRRGVPEDSARAGRVLTFLIGHPAMVQMMTDDADGGLIHIKLAPASGDEQVAVTARVRAIVEARAKGDELVVAPTTVDAVAQRRASDVAERLSREFGVDIAAEDLAGGGGPSPELLVEIAKLRDEALDPEQGAVAVAVPREEVESLKPEELLDLRGKELEETMRERLPTLAAGDAEGVGFAAEHLGAWIDDAKKKIAGGSLCEPLGLGDRCDEASPMLAELSDAEWIVDAPVDGSRTVPLRLRLTGQPVIGAAFAESVTASLFRSTAVSFIALGLVLLVARELRALVPAAWTLVVTAGVIALLGQSISVGTSMVACIALGAGVDFAIHLGHRAKEIGGDHAGREAVRELGLVVVISAVQLSLAFSVLGASEMPPLQDFGVGLAIGLLGAALGAVWLTPVLRSGKARKSAPKAPKNP